MNQAPQGDAQDSFDMARLTAGEDSALTALMSRHAEKLFHYLCRQLGNESEAEDLAQETFVRIYQNRSRFNPRHRFSTWLYTIATNLVKDRFRFRARHPNVSLDDSFENMPDKSAPASEAAQRNEQSEAVRSAIAALPEQLRLPLILFEYEEKSQAEIGQILGCSAKAVEVRLYRARQELRLRLSKWLAQ